MTRDEDLHAFFEWFDTKAHKEPGFLYGSPMYLARAAYEFGRSRVPVEPRDAALWDALSKDGVLDFEARIVGYQRELPRHRTTVLTAMADVVRFDDVPRWKLDIHWVGHSIKSLRDLARHCLDKGAK
jgi:hypothetical protein